MNDLKKVLVVEYNNIDFEDDCWAFITTSIEDACNFMKSNTDYEKNTDYDKSHGVWYWSTSWCYIGEELESISDEKYDLKMYHFTGEGAENIEEIEQLFDEKKINLQKEENSEQETFYNNYNTVLIVEPQGFTGDGRPYFIASSEENAQKYMLEHMHYITEITKKPKYWVTYNQKLNEIRKMGRNGEHLNYYHFTGETAKDLDEINAFYIEKRKSLKNENCSKSETKDSYISDMCAKCDIYCKSKY